MLARTIIAACLLALAWTSPGAAQGSPGGAFTCDFRVVAEESPAEIAGLLERDRIYMARRPGMLHKVLPFRPDPASGEFESGGRYLFDTWAQALDYERFVTREFTLDGVPFLERSYFRDPDCRAWRTIGAADPGDVETTRAVVRAERWEVGGDQEALAEDLAASWPGIEAAARARGLSSVWLLHDPRSGRVALVYQDAHGPGFGEADALDPVALLALERAAPLGAGLERPGWQPIADRTHWVLTIWFPNPGAGDRGRASLWPNSPGFPEPTPVDGVCVPSRGEHAGTAPLDCTERCGDGVADPGEDSRRCPSDVEASAAAGRR